MPASKGAPPDTTTTAPEASAESVGASPSPAPTEAAPQPKGGVFEYTAPFTTVYGLPLTAHPLVPAVPATDEDPGSPEVPATVFDWPDGPPDDRWTPTRRKPNQARDNDAPLTSTEV